MGKNRRSRRAIELEARRTLKRDLGRQTAITLGVARSSVGVLSRGFWGRLKWILFGR